MKTSFEIEQAENGYTVVTHDWPHKSTYVFTDFPSMKKWVDQNVRRFEPTSLIPSRADAGETATPEQVATMDSLGHNASPVLP